MRIEPGQFEEGRPEEKPERGSDDSDVALDALLAQAKWPGDSEASNERLLTYWNSVKPVRSPIWRWGRIAAVLAVTAGVGLVVYGRLGRVDRLSATLVAPGVATIEPPPSMRPATGLELAMLKASAPERSSTTRPASGGVPLYPLVTGWGMDGPPRSARPAVAVQSPPPADPEQLTRIVATSGDPAAVRSAWRQLVDMGPDRAGETVLNLLATSNSAEIGIDALCRTPAAWIDRLFASLGDSHTAVRQAAADALARIDGPDVTARLADMAMSNIHRPEAVAALVRIPSPQARRFVAVALQTPRLNVVVRSALLQNQISNSQSE